MKYNVCFMKNNKFFAIILFLISFLQISELISSDSVLIGNEEKYHINKNDNFMPFYKEQICKYIRCGADNKSFYLIYKEKDKEHNYGQNFLNIYKKTINFLEKFDKELSTNRIEKAKLEYENLRKSGEVLLQDIEACKNSTGTIKEKLMLPIFGAQIFAVGSIASCIAFKNKSLAVLLGFSSCYCTYFGIKNYTHIKLLNNIKKAYGFSEETVSKRLSITKNNDNFLIDKQKIKEIKVSVSTAPQNTFPINY